MKLSKTVQRKVIVDELRKLKCHPTADELYEVVRRKLPRISLGTVYRNLEVLSANGEIQRLGLGRKQMCFDGNTSRQYHLVCRLCGAIEDIKAGRIERAISRCRNIWASLPGAGYGQREHSLDKLVTVWRTAGGVME